jgi:hypothetical protein
MMSKRLLGFLVPAFIAALIYGYLQMPRQERVTTGDGKALPRQQAKQLPGAKTAATGSGGYPRLRSDLLEHKSQPYPGVRRNLFSAYFLLAPEEDEVEILPEELPEVIIPPIVEVVPPPPPPPPPLPQEIVRQELALYKFVGFYKKGEKTTIFLASAGEVFLVRKGDYLGRDRRYYVVNITDTNMELRKEGVGDFSIKLTDQESLSAVPLRHAPSLSPVIPGQAAQEQESDLPDQPEFLPVIDEKLPNDDQLQPQEDY